MSGSGSRETGPAPITGAPASSENNSKFSKMSLKNAQESLSFAEKVLENEIIKYKAGTSSVLLVSQAQNQVISAQQELLKKEFNVISSQLAINKIINQ